MTKPSPTARQQEVLAVFADWQARLGYPPTMREIAKVVGVSPAATNHLLRALCKHGHLTRSQGSIARGYQLSRPDGSPAPALPDTRVLSLKIYATYRDGALVPAPPIRPPGRPRSRRTATIRLSAQHASPGGKVCAVLVGDAGMAPAVPQGAIVIVRRDRFPGHDDVAVWATDDGVLVVRRWNEHGGLMRLETTNGGGPTVCLPSPLPDPIVKRVIGTVVSVYFELSPFSASSQELLSTP